MIFANYMNFLLVSATPSFGPKFLRDSLRKNMGEMRDNFGTDLGKFWEKIGDRSRGHLAASLINHY